MVQLKCYCDLRPDRSGIKTSFSLQTAHVVRTSIVRQKEKKKKEKEKPSEVEIPRQIQTNVSKENKQTSS